MVRTEHFQITEEFITPELAKKYLETNITNNRRISLAKVDQYKRDMMSDNWHITHQGIAFNSRGQLFDGQHRLNAIIKSGLGQLMLVIRYLKEDTDEVIKGVDIGSVRKQNDILKISTGKIVTTRDLAFIRMFNPLKLGGTKLLTPSEMNQFFDDYPNIMNCARFIQSDNCATALAVACVCSIINGCDSNKVKSFVKAVYNNEIIEGFNCKAALDFRDIQRGIHRANFITGRYTLENEAENALYKYLNNIKNLKDKSKERYPVDMKKINGFVFNF